MKNKLLLIIGLATIGFFVPAISIAMPAPWVSLTVNVNTPVDANFHFSLSHNPDFYLQTANSTGSTQFYFYNPTGSYTLLENKISGLKVKDIFCTSDNPADAFFTQSNSVTFTPQLFETIICTFNNVKDKTPVLIVPGIIGTEMKKENELLWPDITRMITNISDNFMDPLGFQLNLTPSDSNVSKGKLVGEPFPGEHYYDLIINEFAGQGYVEGESLFTFPYDWRYGVTGKYADGKTNSDLLKSKIQEILAETGADKVDVVAHSMGGLVVKKYVTDNASDNHIGKAVFVGVPETGAPKAAKVLLQGDNFGVVGLSDAEIKKISANMPCVYDLLPSQKYYNTAGSFIRLLDNTADSSHGAFSISDQTIVSDLDYSQAKSFLVSNNNFNQQAMDSAEGLHTQAFDDFDMRSAGIDLYAIDGCKTGTMVKFEQAKTKNIFGQAQTSFAPFDLKTGDGTVPIQSSTNLPIDQTKKYYALIGEHGKLMSQGGSRQEIVNLISGSSLIVDPKIITQDANNCQLTGKAFIVYSPVDISVTDQNGNKLGLENGNIANEIPNADFEVWGEHKFIYLPTDNGQNYQINMQGTGNGIFTIKAESIENGQITQTESFVDIPVTSALTGSVNLSSSAPTTLTIRQKPGSAPKIILPAEQLPESKEKCKKNGWKIFSQFKNQGDCVSFMEKWEKAKHNFIDKILKPIKEKLSNRR